MPISASAGNVMLLLNEKGKTMNAADLVAEFIKIDDFVKAESKKFSDHLAPHKKRMEEISNLLLGVLNEQKTNSMSTDNGTAYLSTIMTPKVVDRERYIDFIFEDYDKRAEMFQIAAPQKEALREYLDSYAEPPPGVSVSYFNRLNIRRS